MSEQWQEMLTEQKRKIIDELEYFPSDGEFRWRRSGRGQAKREGALAGSSHSRGYVRIKVCGKTYFAHRLAWLFMTGAWPSEEIDHINRDRSDNRFSNLRAATVAENRRNNPGQPTRRKSSLKGVSKENKSSRWFAKIHTDGATRVIGRFNTEAEAALAYREAASQDHGEFASW